MNFRCFIIYIFFLVPFILLAEDGDLDATFGTNGIATFSIGSGDANFRQSELQSDGKIVVVGYSNNGSNDDIMLARLKTDGTMDSTFGTNGIVNQTVGTGDDYGSDLAILNDGSIIVVGYYDNGTDQDIVVLKYDSDGDLDNTFGTNGIFTSNISSDNEKLIGVAIQDDDKIVASGRSEPSDNWNSLVIRLTSSGSFDNTFGTGGIVDDDLKSGETDYLYDILIQNDGKIVTVGYLYNPDNALTLHNCIVLRLESNGSRDNSFGNNGNGIQVVASNQNPGQSGAVSIGLDFAADGSIIVCGTVRPSNVGNYNYQFLVVSVDSSDGSENWKHQELLGNTYRGDKARDVAVLANGDIIAVGYYYNTNNYDLIIKRLKSDGTLDTNFDDDGVVYTSVSSNDDYIYCISVQDDGNFVVVGQTYDGSNYDALAMRYEGSVAPLPVELTSFTAELIDDKVQLNWETATEVNNYGFEIERAILNSQFLILNWTKLGFVPGYGTTNSPKSYSFTDSELPDTVSTVSYRLKQIDNDGTFTYSKIVTVDLSNITSVDDELNYTFSLEQNYPNPFNPTTTIKFTIPSNSKNETLTVRLVVYNSLGQQVAILVNEQKPQGIYEMQFNGSLLSSGVYFYKLSYSQFSATKKLLLMK